MWQWLLSMLIPLVLHLGVEAVLARWPNLPPWIVGILKALEGAKQAAQALPADQQAQALAAAKGDALKAFYVAHAAVKAGKDPLADSSVIGVAPSVKRD